MHTHSHLMVDFTNHLQPRHLSQQQQQKKTLASRPQASSPKKKEEEKERKYQQYHHSFILVEEQKWILIHTFYKHFYTWAEKRHPTLTGSSRKTPTNRNHTDTHLSRFVHSGLMALHVFPFVSRFEMNIDDYEMLQTMADTGTASLDTTTPIYFGGVPPEYKIKDGSSLTKNRFIGCIGDITVQKKWVNRKGMFLFNFYAVHWKRAKQRGWALSSKWRLKSGSFV